MRTTASMEDPLDLPMAANTRGPAPVLNTNKLQGTLCILLSAAVSIGTIVFLVRTLL